MSKRKGLSADEKKSRLRELFYEKKEFFQLKDLEKMAPKEKGIIAQSVKDVLKSLVDDNMVEADKIGTSVYFWAFPSKAVLSTKQKLQGVKSKLEELERRYKILQDKITEVKAERQETKIRSDVLAKLEKLKYEIEHVSSEIQLYKDSDPEYLDQIKNESKQAKEGVNRWTDNIFAVKSWCKNRFNIEEETMNKQFGVSPEMDYIE